MVVGGGRWSSRNGAGGSWMNATSIWRREQPKPQSFASNPPSAPSGAEPLVVFRACNAFNLILSYSSTIGALRRGCARSTSASVLTTRLGAAPHRLPCSSPQKKTPRIEAERCSESSWRRSHRPGGR